MMKINNTWLFLWVIVVFPTFSQERDTLLTALKEELLREITELRKQEIPAYYIDYRVNEIQTGVVNGSFGSLTGSNENKARIFSANVKVGDYALDNTHEEPGMQPGMPQHFGGLNLIPIDEDPMVIKLEAWLSTQRQYKSAVESYKLVKNVLASKSNKSIVKLADFTREKPSVYFEKKLPPVSSLWNSKEWIEKVKKFSALFRTEKDLLSGDVNFRIETERKYFVSSEGSEVVHNQKYSYLFISSSIRSEDGDIIPLSKSYYAPDPGLLPGESQVESDIRELIAKLKLLKKAPLAEPYTGPAILYAQAAGVFFHEIFGHRVEGHRLRSEYDGQTFKEKVNEQVLPKSLNVIFDPTVSEFQGKPLNGCYKFDDEGVKSQKVTAVENGILKNFLMSRMPLQNFNFSNGHGRGAYGADPVSRQSNLIVENSKPVSFQELRLMLIKECKKQGKKYGYFFKDVTGGFTTTDRFNPNAFNIFPTEVYRIFVDGRPDELVRGVDLIGTPLAMFAEIMAAGDKSEVFVGFCGAESGSVPVSAVAPSLFVRRIETQKKPKANSDETLLPSPEKNN